MKKQADKIELRISEANEISTELARKADELIDQHKIGEKLIMSLPYKFAETLLKDSQFKTHENAKDHKKVGQISISNEKYYIKPKINLKNRKNVSSSLDKPDLANSRYRTVENREQLTPHVDSKGDHINDKNLSL